MHTFDNTLFWHRGSISQYTRMAKNSYPFYHIKGWTQELPPSPEGFSNQWLAHEQEREKERETDRDRDHGSCIQDGCALTPHLAIEVEQIKSKDAHLHLDGWQICILTRNKGLHHYSCPSQGSLINKNTGKQKTTTFFFLVLNTWKGRIWEFSTSHATASASMIQDWTPSFSTRGILAMMSGYLDVLFSWFRLYTSTRSPFSTWIWKIGTVQISKSGQYILRVHKNWFHHTSVWWTAWDQSMNTFNSISEWIIFRGE